MSEGDSDDVRIRTGTRESLGILKMLLSTSTPWTPGKLRSSRMRSGARRPSCDKFFSAPSPSSKHITSHFMSFSWRAFLTRRTSAGLSSTSTMLAVLNVWLIDLVLGRDCEFEVGPAPRLRLHPNASPEALHHLPANRQTDAAAGVLPAIQPVKHAKNLLRTLRVDADAVILDRKNPFPLVLRPGRSEEHTSELQSQSNLVCRLLLEKKKT